MSFKFNPITGKLDLKGSGGSGPVVTDVELLKKTLIADENISALRVVYMTSQNNCALADYQNPAKRFPIGMSITSATTGGNVEVVLFGQINDPFFSYAINAPLFLSNAGAITDTAPTTDWSINVGKSLGVGSIFISINRPIIL